MFQPNLYPRFATSGLPQDVLDRCCGIIEQMLNVTDRYGRKVSRHEDGNLVRTPWDLTHYDCTKYVQALTTETDPIQRARMMKGDLIHRLGNIAGALYWHELERFQKARAEELRAELKVLRQTYAEEPSASPIRLVLVELAGLVRVYSGAAKGDQTVARQVASVGQDVLWRHIEALRTFYDVAVNGMGDYSYVHFDLPVIELSEGPDTALELSAALLEARSVRGSFDRAMANYHQAKCNRNPPQFASRLEEALRVEASGGFMRERMNSFAEIKLQQTDAEACFFTATAGVEQPHGDLEKTTTRLNAALAGETSNRVRAELANAGWGFNCSNAISSKRMVNCIAARYWLHQLNETEARYQKAKSDRYIPSFQGGPAAVFDEFAYVDAVLNQASPVQ